MGLASWGSPHARQPVDRAILQQSRGRTGLPIAALTFIIASVGSVSPALMTRDFRYRRRRSSTGAAPSHSAWWRWRSRGAGGASGASLCGYRKNDGPHDCLSVSRPLVAKRPFSSAAMARMLSFGVGMYVKRLLDYGPRISTASSSVACSARPPLDCTTRRSTP